MSYYQSCYVNFTMLARYAFLFFPLATKTFPCPPGAQIELKNYFSQIHQCLILTDMELKFFSGYPAQRKFKKMNNHSNFPTSFPSIYITSKGKSNPKKQYCHLANLTSFSVFIHCLSARKTFIQRFLVGARHLPSLHLLILDQAAVHSCLQ